MGVCHSEAVMGTYIRDEEGMFPWDQLVVEVCGVFCCQVCYLVQLA